MNFFFGINSDYLSTQLTIPKFNNNANYEKCSVFSAQPNNNQWTVKKVECEQNENFYFIENSKIRNDLIFFLAKDNEVQKKNYSSIKNFAYVNSFTDTQPSAFRSNLKIYLKDGGFSSYQSEYPYLMTTKTGNILSPLNTLLDPDADKNLIYFRNIFHLPNKNESKLFILDIKKKIILDIVKINNNYSNEIQINKKLIDNNNYIFSEQALGIPLYVSIKNSHISFEHTHPPHHYIISDNQFVITNNLKKEIKSIIYATN